MTEHNHLNNETTTELVSIKLDGKQVNGRISYSLRQMDRYCLEFNGKIIARVWPKERDKNIFRIDAYKLIEKYARYAEAMRDLRIMVLVDDKGAVDEDAKRFFENAFDHLAEHQQFSYSPLQKPEDHILKAIGEYQPGIIFISARRQGFYIIKKIKANLKPAPVIVAVDWKGAPDNKLVAQTVGADDYLSGKISAEDLLDRVVSWVKTTPEERTLKKWVVALGIADGALVAANFKTLGFFRLVLDANQGILMAQLLCIAFALATIFLGTFFWAKNQLKVALICFGLGFFPGVFVFVMFVYTHL